MKSYVTYADDGKLTGAYLQEPPASHTQIIEVSDAIRASWPLYRANERRNGVELIPVTAPSPRVPEGVTARQAVEALIGIGVYEEHVEAAIAAIQDDTQRRKVANLWRRSNSFERDNQVLNWFAKQSLGMSDAQLDQLFIVASTL